MKPPESWFGAEIACCDNCYADFVSKWPHAENADGSALQLPSTDFDSLYNAGGRLAKCFDRAEYDALVRNFICPRCEGFIGHNIWAYELPFGYQREFERVISEIAQIIANDPLKVEHHPFVEELRGVIAEEAARTGIEIIPVPLFKGRTTSKGPIEERLESFGFAPPSVVREGRYNRKGEAALYLASDKETCHAELRDQPCQVMEFQLLLPIKILNLANPVDKHQNNSDLLNCAIYSAIISAKEDSVSIHKPHYTVSKLIASFAKSYGFDAIMYPSTRRTDKNFI